MPSRVEARRGAVGSKGPSQRACPVAPVNLAPNVQCSTMSTDSVLVYLGTAVRLAGVNRFYTRRVLQRCERGEITFADAAQLLMAAAYPAP